MPCRPRLPTLTLNAVAVLRVRYLRRDDRGRVVESTGEMMERVARHVAQAEDEPERCAEECAACSEASSSCPTRPP